MIEFTVRGPGEPVQKESVFHFVTFGNFTGSDQQRAHLKALEAGRSSFDQVMQDMRPAVRVSIQLPNIADLIVDLEFLDLRGFSKRGLSRSIPLLESLRLLRGQIAETHEERPLELASLFSLLPDAHRLVGLAQANQGQNKPKTIDLLSMVDLGDEESALELPQLHHLFSMPTYTGSERPRLLAEIDQLAKLVLDQVVNHARIKELHGYWRGLRSCIGKLPAHVRVSVVDCSKDELCDALFLLFVKPEQGSPLPIDMAICCERFSANEPDRHAQFHLSRMAESLAIPLLLEVDLSLFGLRSWRQMSHLQEIGAKLNGPSHLKWRKLREESCSEWLFLAVNPLSFGSSDSEDDSEVLIPAVFLLAALVGAPLEELGSWPAELLNQSSDLAGGVAAKLSDSLAEDMAFWGLCPVVENRQGELSLKGMTSYAQLTIRRADGRMRPADLIPYSLPYRFYAGCCARYLSAGKGDLTDFRRFAKLGREEALEIEEGEQGRTLRLRPAFTIFGAQPDLLIDA